MCYLFYLFWNTSSTFDVYVCNFHQTQNAILHARPAQTQLRTVAYAMTISFFKSIHACQPAHQDSTTQMHTLAQVNNYLRKLLNVLLNHIPVVTFSFSQVATVPA